MSEIVRTETLFGSKKNIIGSTSTDLVLETLGKVYIKTGKSTKTLTEILSQYSKKSGNETSGTGNITTEQILNLLSAEYIKSLVDQILKEHKIYGNFVTIESLQGVGNLNLPIYFDINSEPQTITGLEVTNKIYTDDEVRGERGVSTAGISDLTVIGGYAHGLDESQLRGLGYRTETELTVSFNSLLNSSLSGYKPLLEIITLTSLNVKTVGSITQSASGIIEATFIDIPDAGAELKGFVNTENLVFSGNKTFNNSVTAVEQVTTPIINTSNVKAETQLDITTNNSKRADFSQNGLAVVGGVSASGICDLTPIGGYNDNIINSLSGIGTFRGTFESESDLPTSNYQGNVLLNNDYAFTIELSGQNPEYVRWKYNGTQWVKEYTITNSGFTADQWTTINSGLTSIGGNTITTLGTIIIGTWNASAIVDDYISSASTWNNAASAISTISGYFDSNNKVKEGNLDATAIINALGTNAVKRAVADQNGLTIDTSYLKLTGGRIKGNSTAYPLEICSSSASLVKAGIKYYKGGSNVTLLGYIGVDSSVGAFYLDSVGNFNTIWHSNNSNKSNVDWQCNVLTVNNTANLNGGENHIGASGQNDIFLGRTSGANYIHIPTTGNSSETAALVITRGSSSNPLFTIHTDNSVYITRSLVVSQNIRATEGIAAGGIADLTIAYSSSVILSLQSLIDALQDLIDALS